MEKKFMNVKEVSQYLGFKVSTVYRWAETKSIPCFKINGALRFREEDIREWVENCRKVS